jgi:hypothetical protein
MLPSTVHGGEQLWLSIYAALQQSFMFDPYRKVERQVKVLMKHLAIFFLIPSKKFLPISFEIQLLETTPQKVDVTNTKVARCLFFLMTFPFLYILNSLQSSLTVYILLSLSAC